MRGTANPVVRGFDNLLIASPAISASHLVSDSARIIRTTVEKGEAAGAAAALANKDHVGFATLAHNPTANVNLQDDLELCGVYPHTGSDRTPADHEPAVIPPLPAGKFFKK